MNLESLPKFYSPKSPKLNDSTPATAGDGLTITDVMAAQGMVQSLAPLGFNLFLAKMGIQGPEPAIDGLMNYAMALNNPVLKKLSDKARLEILPVLVRFAFADYSRSSIVRVRVLSKQRCLPKRCNILMVSRLNGLQPLRGYVHHTGKSGKMFRK